MRHGQAVGHDMQGWLAAGGVGLQRTEPWERPVCWQVPRLVQLAHSGTQLWVSPHQQSLQVATCPANNQGTGARLTDCLDYDAHPVVGDELRQHWKFTIALAYLLFEVLHVKACYCKTHVVSLQVKAPAEAENERCCACYKKLS